jgi:hypothetical protein
MKHIETYKLFERSNSEEEIEVKAYVKDILIELDHDGFKTGVFLNEDGSIDIYVTNKKKFEYKDIEDVMLTIDDYIYSVGYKEEWYPREPRSPVMFISQARGNYYSYNIKYVI